MLPAALRYLSFLLAMYTFVIASCVLCTNAQSQLQGDSDLDLPSIERFSAAPCDESHSTDRFGSDHRPASLWDELYFRFAVDGSKQPQEFGVNAHVGGQASMNWGIPILPNYGMGIQAGTGITATANAVRVYELLGESTGRTQNFTTLGMFQRTESGFGWGFVHDFLYQDYFDSFQLGQWRVRWSFELTQQDQVGMTTMLKSYGADGVFGANTNIRLQPIDQVHFYWRRYWETGAQTSFWAGLAEGHGEDNAVTGFSAPKEEQFLFGADVLMPLTRSLAIYGETNMMMPSDTGTVDAFLGVHWYPGGKAFTARRGRFSPMMELASPVSFSTDLSRR